MLPRQPVVCRSVRRRSPLMANRAHIPQHFPPAGNITPSPSESDEPIRLFLFCGDAARRTEAAKRPRNRAFMCSPDQVMTEARLSTLPSALTKGMEPRPPQLHGNGRLRLCGPLGIELVWSGRCRRWPPPKYGPAAVVMRLLSFMRDQLPDRRTRG